MTRLHGPWKVLGLAPTQDNRQIRRAYAAKLKAIDVERDPQAFIALREAFESAQHIARWMEHQHDTEEDAEAESLDATGNAEADAPEMAELIGSLQVDPGQAPLHEPTPQRASADREGPWSPPTPEKFDAHASALARLLQRNNLEPRPWPSDAEREEMLAHWRVLIADPRVHQLDFYADLERWVAGLIGCTIPFSDTLILPVTEYFGWMRDEGMIGQSDGLAEVIYRYRMLRFLEDIRTPGHQHYEAWCELTAPADEDSARGRISVRKVHKLLHDVRVAYPGLEGNFQPERVALWDRGGTGDSLGPVVPDEKQPWRIPGFVIWLFLALVVIPLAGSLSDKKSGPTFRTSEEAALLAGRLGLTDENRDIAVLLKDVGDGSLTLKQIEEKDPKLAQLIRSNWQIGKEQGQTLFTFLNNVAEVLNERAFNRIATASPDTLVAYRTLMLDKARALRRISPDKCAGFFLGKPVNAADLPGDVYKRQRAMISRLLLEPAAEPKPRTGPTTFSIPMKVFDDAAVRAKISQKRMQEAAMHRGSPADICDGRIGLGEAVIAMPAGAERTKLLRSL